LEEEEKKKEGRGSHREKKEQPVGEGGNVSHWGGGISRSSSERKLVDHFQGGN